MHIYGNIIGTDSSFLFVDTAMTEKIFAQSKLIQFLDEAGICAVHGGDSDYSFEEWRFGGTRLKSSVDGISGIKEGEDTLLLYGPAYDGVPLYERLTAADSRESWKYAVRAAQVFHAAQIAGIQLPRSGPMGIIAGKDGSFLFLPAALFSRSMIARSRQDFNLYEGQWLNENLTKQEDSQAFTAAAFLYTALAGKAPFAGASYNKRITDMYDRNFVPLEFAAPNIVSEISETINGCLGITYTGKQKGHGAQTQKPGIKDIIAVIPEERGKCFTAPGPQDIWEKKTHSFIEKQKKSIQRRRFFRKNRAALLTAVFIAAAAALFIGSFVRDISRRPTTIGMSPLEVAETFYGALSTLDQMTADACVEKKVAKEYIDFISTMYVTSKVRQAYERQRTTMTPAQWLNTEEPWNEWVFGLSRLYIEQSPGYTEEHPVFTVSFYLFIPQPEEQEEGNAAVPAFPLTVSRHKDTVTLSWKKDRWLISALTQNESVPVRVDTAELFENYEQGKVLYYEWAPSQEELAQGLKELYSF